MSTLEIQYAQANTRVVVQPRALASVGTALARCVRPTKILVVSDENVAPHYAQPVEVSLREAGFEAGLVVLPPGDATKCLDQAAKLYDRLGDMKLARDGVLLALGGGMVSDLTGFVAATWMRGVPFAICPTTLEADIDASIGGKTAVNHPTGKNLIGAFHQPVLVNIDPLCLETLARRDVVAGLAESIKHALIADGAFLTWHEQKRDAILAREPGMMVELIERNVRIKAGVVTEDEREQNGVRASLNFGHTIGHAIEAARGYELRHGECVALGMAAACRLSVSQGLLDAASAERIIGLVESFGLPVRLPRPVSTEVLLGFMGRDKKIASGRLRFVLLDGIGRTVLRSDVPREATIEAIASLSPT